MAWTSVGDDAAPAVLILHGGPGGRSRAASVNWFDGLRVRCIVHDQRGCGASTPAGATAHNDLDTLVADIERLREHLGLAQWAVAGGSWGALLAVAYAARHPSRVQGLFLRSSFLGSANEVAHFFLHWPRWLGEAGVAALGGLPSAGAAAGGLLPDPVAWLDAIDAAGGSPVHAARVARAWLAYEQAQALPGGLLSAPAARWTAATPEERSGDGLPPGLRVQWHYLRHGCFVDEGQRRDWLSTLDAALVDHPVVLVHGQADVVCDVAVSRQLAARWPQATLTEVPGAGHDMDHPALREALAEAAAAWCQAWRPAALAPALQAGPDGAGLFQRSLR